MRKTLLAVLAIVLLTACSLGSKPNASKTSTQAESTAASSTTPAATPDDAILTELQAGQHPPCSQVVSEPAKFVVVSAAGQIDLHCITGTSADTDKTKVSSILCDPGDPNSLVYYWASQTPTNTDQNVYAAKVGGVVVVVANQTAAQFVTQGPAVAAVLAAVGVRC